MSNSSTSQAVIAFLSLVLIAWSINFTTIQVLLLSQKIALPLWWLVYLFLVPLTMLELLVTLRSISRRGRQSIATGKVYLIAMTVKSILSLCFLSPWILFKDSHSKPMVIQFFFLFFLLTAIEIKLIVNYLSSYSSPQDQ